MRSVSARGNVVSRKTNVILNVVFALGALACVLPVILVLSISLSDQQSITLHGYKFIPASITFDAYFFLFKDWITIIRAYGVSILITVLGTALNVFLMALYAYPLSRRDYPFRGFFTFLIFFTMLFSGGIVTKYILYVQVLSLKNSMLALILPLLIAPFNVIIMRTFFQTTIHPALIESAKIDGAREFTILFRIILPLSLPVMATMALFSTLAYWNDWFNALLFLTKEDLYPLQYLMMKVMNQIQFIRDNLTKTNLPSEVLSNLPSDSLRMAMAIIGMGPIIIVYPFFQKYFIQGLTIGAVKG